MDIIWICPKHVYQEGRTRTSVTQALSSQVLSFVEVSIILVPPCGGLPYEKGFEGSWEGSWKTGSTLKPGAYSKTLACQIVRFVVDVSGRLGRNWSKVRLLGGLRGSLGWVVRLVGRGGEAEGHRTFEYGVSRNGKVTRQNSNCGQVYDDLPRSYHIRTSFQARRKFLGYLDTLSGHNTARILRTDNEA